MSFDHPSPDEERLRSRFQELRAGDQRSAPDFQRMLVGRRPGRSPWGALVPAAALAAAAVLVLWFGAGTMLGREAPQAAAPVAAAPAPAVAAGEGAFDPAPLDFLLDVPGSAPRSVRTRFDSNPLQGW